MSDPEAEASPELCWYNYALFLRLNIVFRQFHVGGQTPEGEDATNELSYLFLESKREFPMTYPDLAVRMIFIYDCYNVIFEKKWQLTSPIVTVVSIDL